MILNNKKGRKLTLKKNSIIYGNSNYKKIFKEEKGNLFRYLKTNDIKNMESLNKWKFKEMIFNYVDDVYKVENHKMRKAIDRISQLLFENKSDITKKLNRYIKE